MSHHRRHRLFGRARTRMSGFASKVRRFGGGIPSYAKPSKAAAVIGVATGAAQLAFTPLPDGDSWVKRSINGFAAYKASGNPADILAQDAPGTNTGNDVTSILALQLQQNAVPALFTIGGFGIGAAILKHFGL